MRFVLFRFVPFRFVRAVRLFAAECIEMGGWFAPSVCVYIRDKSVSGSVVVDVVAGRWCEISRVATRAQLCMSVIWTRICVAALGLVIIITTTDYYNYYDVPYAL